MAKVVGTEQRNGHTIQIYESGAEYDMTAKHLVKAPPRAMITADNAREMQARNQVLKRKAVTDAANAVVAASGSVNGDLYKAQHGNLAWVAAISEAVTMRALDNSNANTKQIDAARWLTAEAGLAEQRSQEQPQRSNTDDVLDRLYVIAQAVLARRQDDNDSVIDADE